MATVLRRGQSGSSCFKFLQRAIGQKPCGSERVPCSRLSPIVISQGPCFDWMTFPPSRSATSQDSITKRIIWRTEHGHSIRHFHAGQEALETRDEKRTGNAKLVLYRAKWIRPIRLVVRLKLLQFAGVVALAIPLAEYSQQGSLSLGTTAAVAAVVGGAGAASAALWYYSRRLIGEMALLLPDMCTVQISVLDFWGNREDLQFDVRDIVPPLKGMTKEELECAAQQTLMPLDVMGDRQFFLSLRHAHLVNKDILFSVLNGSVEWRDLQNRESST